MASVKRLLSIAFCCVVAVSAAAQRLPDRSRTPDFESLWPLRFDFLKRVYFALRNEGDEYKAGYEKYNAIVGTNE